MSTNLEDKKLSVEVRLELDPIKAAMEWLDIQSCCWARNFALGLKKKRWDETAHFEKGRTGRIMKQAEIYPIMAANVPDEYKTCSASARQNAIWELEGEVYKSFARHVDKEKRKGMQKNWPDEVAPEAYWAVYTGETLKYFPKQEAIVLPKLGAVKYEGEIPERFRISRVKVQKVLDTFVAEVHLVKLGMVNTNPNRAVASTRRQSKPPEDDLDVFFTEAISWLERYERTDIKEKNIKFLKAAQENHEAVGISKCVSVMLKKWENSETLNAKGIKAARNVEAQLAEDLGE